MADADLTDAYRFWLSKLGRQRLREIAASILGDDESLPRRLDDLTDIVFDFFGGDESEFRGPYHQTIYIRQAEDSYADAQSSLKSVSLHSRTEDIEARRTETQGGTRSVLFWIYTSQEFRIESDEGDRVESREIRVPVFVKMDSTQLRVHVLTIKTHDWTPLLGDDVKSSIGQLRSDNTRDVILDFLSTASEPNAGTQLDFSANSKNLMRLESVDTFSGTFLRAAGGAPKAATSHRTLGQSERKGLREAVPDEFEELTHSPTILDCEIQFAKKLGAIQRGTRLKLRPTSGEVLVSRQLDEASLQACLERLTV